ncbi:MAG: translational GTPase TypA [Patescibacteria group bacterium]
MEIRNIAIIAHVDHGKTTLTDALMRETGQALPGVSMDSNTLELERGITIYSKNAAVFYKGTKINIVDTPGHSDFGSEVERVLRSIDTVLLVVDAQEGPMPQTRFVLKKSLELGLKPIVVVNKIDKPAARPEVVHEMVLELFLELGANNEQIDFPTVYAIGREGVAMRNINDERKSLNPLLDLILEKVPSASKVSTWQVDTLRAQPFNLAYDNFLGRLAIARIYEGKVERGQEVYVNGKKAKITKLFTFEGIKRKEVEEVLAGDICMLAGIPDIYIGDTISGAADATPLPSINVDEPTISLNFLVNNSPFAGREGKFVTGRQIRERLERELEVNVGLKVDFNVDHGLSSQTVHYTVSGRGELHIAILCENMRREGFEFQISQPKVIIKDDTEPFEEVVIDVPEEFSGGVISTLTSRRAQIIDMKNHENQTRIIFEAPTRALLGYRSQFVIDTKGLGIFSSRFTGFKNYAGEIQHRNVGAIISMEAGKCLAFSLDNLQQRGTLYVEPGDEVYAGQVIGNAVKGEDMYVNPTKGKQLTNMRASGSDEGIFLTPAWKLDIERAMEVMNEDEYIEITPRSVRLRKIYLTQQERSKALRKA